MGNNNGKSQAKSNEPNISEKFIENFICAMLSLKTIPLITEIKTYGDLLLYVSDADAYINNFDNKDNFSIRVYKTNEFGQRISKRSKAWYTQVVYYYNNTEFFKINKYNSSILSYGTQTNNTFENVIWSLNENNYKILKKSGYGYETYNENYYEYYKCKLVEIKLSDLELLKQKIDFTIDNIGDTLKNKIESRSNFNINELTTTIESIKDKISDLTNENLELQNKMKIICTLKENNVASDKIRNNAIDLKKLQMDLTNANKKLEDYNNFENYCNICNFQITILKHFLLML